MSNLILCDDCREDLPAYLRGELTEECAYHIRQHLERCPECRNAATGTEEILDLVQRSLPPLQAPEGFAARLRARLDAEKTTLAEKKPQGMQRPSDRISRRLQAFPRRSLRERLITSARRSPYFVASLSLHAAAVAILVILLVRVQREPVAPIVTGGTNTAAMSFEIQELSNAWGIRRDCASVTVVAKRLPEGLLIDCPQFLSEGALDLVDAPELGCVKGYRAAAGAVGKRAVVTDARILIPTELADKRLPGQTLTVRVLDLEDRVEFWAQPRWESFSREFAGNAPEAKRRPALCAADATPGGPLLARSPAPLPTCAASVTGEKAVRRKGTQTL